MSSCTASGSVVVVADGSVGGAVAGTVVVGPVEAGADVDDGTVVDDVVVVIGNVKLGGVGLVSGSPLLQAATTNDATPRPITQHAGRAIRSSCPT
jgi:hypothetical protein